MQLIMLSDSQRRDDGDDASLSVLILSITVLHSDLIM